MKMPIENNQIIYFNCFEQNGSWNLLAVGNCLYFRYFLFVFYILCENYGTYTALQTPYLTFILLANLVCYVCCNMSSHMSVANEWEMILHSHTFFFKWGYPSF